MDKAALLARAKTNPVAFREETAEALERAGIIYASERVSAGHGIAPEAMSHLRIFGVPWPHGNVGTALAHVEALAEALGMKL